MLVKRIRTIPISNELVKAVPMSAPADPKLYFIDYVYDVRNTYGGNKGIHITPEVELKYDIE